MFETDIRNVLRRGVNLNDATALHFAVANARNALIAPLIRQGNLISNTM